MGLWARLWLFGFGMFLVLVCFMFDYRRCVYISLLFIGLHNFL